MKFSAIILAGDREAENPVARTAGVECKVLAPVNGVPMISRVTAALDKAESVENIIICGPKRSTFEKSDVLGKLCAQENIDWIEPGISPSSSAWQAMKHLSENSDPNRPVLVTTGDHALITPEMIDYFCNTSAAKGCDVTAALARADKVNQAFPRTRRTVYKLKDGGFCSCNLFGFLTPKAGNAAQFWQSVEAKRKKPLYVVNSFGWLAAFKYIFGILTLKEGLKRISSCLGCRADVVIMPWPEAAVDVDTPADLEMVDEISRRCSEKT